MFPVLNSSIPVIWKNEGKILELVPNNIRDLFLTALLELNLIFVNPIEFDEFEVEEKFIIEFTAIPQHKVIGSTG